MLNPPILVTICSSSVIQWAEKNRGVVEGLLVAALDVVPSAPGPFIPASTSHVVDTTVLPVLDEELNCNCFRQGSSVILNFVADDQVVEAIGGGISNIDLNDGDESEIVDDEPEDLDETTDESDDLDDDSGLERFDSITIQCAGSSFDRFQPVLCSLRKLGSGMKDVKVSLEPEPDNIKDKNALLIKVHFNDTDHYIGYIPVHDLPRVHGAMNEGTLGDITITCVVGKMVPAPGKVILRAYISLLRFGIGKWPSKKHFFTYNENL